MKRITSLIIGNHTSSIYLLVGKVFYKILSNKANRSDGGNMNTEQALVSAQAQRLEALVDPIPGVLKDEAKELMDPTLSAVAGVSIKSAATNKTQSQNLWQFPQSRSRIRKRKSSIRKSRSKSRRSKSRSRNRSKRTARRGQKRTRSGSRSRKTVGRQFGGAQFHQIGGWEWFGWFKSSSSPAVYPNSPQASQDPVPAAQATKQASESRIVKMLKRLLYSALFIKTVYYAANAWGLANELSEDFMAEIRYMTMSKLFTKQAQLHWGFASGLNGYVMMLQGEYIKAVASLTAATAFVTVALLRKRFKSWRKSQFEELEKVFIQQRIDHVKAAAPSVDDTVPRFPTAILADPPPSSALDKTPLDEKEIERLEHIYTVAAYKNDIKEVERILATRGFADVYNSGLVRPFILQKRMLPTDVPTNVQVVKIVLKAIMNSGVAFPVSNLVFAYVLDRSGNEDYDTNPRRPTFEQRKEILNMLVTDDKFDFINRLQASRLCNRAHADMQQLGHQITCLTE